MKTTHQDFPVHQMIKSNRRALDTKIIVSIHWTLNQALKGLDLFL